jgi:hypothetical protein
VPHFTRQIDPRQGPLVNALVGVSVARRAALMQANEAVPNMVTILALVDTGASCTCIDPGSLSSLGLTPKGSVPVNTPSTGDAPHMADAYDVSLIIPPATVGQTPLAFPNISVIASRLAVQGIQALIGRDILSQCYFTYNGTMGIFTVAY